jgi:hypothetical protein
MSVISLILPNVYENVHVFKMKCNYSEPKIYTAGVNVPNWSSLSKSEQKKALNKEWYIYYSFRHPKTHKLVRQNNIKAGANKYKTKTERLKFLKILQRNLSIILQNGFNPLRKVSRL